MEKAFNKFNPKKVAVLFSGGLDSTYLIYKNLMEGNNVRPIYVEIENNTAKSLIEKQTVILLYHLFNDEINNGKTFPLSAKLHLPKIVTKVNIWKDWDNYLRFNQTPIWLFATNYMSQDVDELQIGYVANDDSIPFIKQIKKTYDAMAWMSDGKRPPLKFPIKKLAKFQILEKLPMTYKKLVFSCESPMILDEKYDIPDEIKNMDGYLLQEFINKNNKFNHYEPCGNCDPCRKILVHDYLIQDYKRAQPIFEKLHTTHVLNQYGYLLDRANYDTETKEMINNFNGKRNLSLDKEVIKVPAKDYSSVALLSMNVKENKSLELSGTQLGINFGIDHEGQIY